ncbi:MAG: alpha/beta fold hydrolase, partial [Myxococcota bacterium]
PAEPVADEHQRLAVDRGFELGGAVAVEMARRRPERVRALVVVAYGQLERPWDWWQRMLTLTERPSDYLARAFFEPPNVPSALLQRLEARLESPAYRNFLTPTDAAALEHQFDGIEVPTLFVGAEQDAILPRRAIEEAAAHVPGSRIEWLARCGHLAHMDRSQELLTIIRSFVASVPALESA